MSKLPLYPIVVRRCKDTDRIELFMMDRDQLSCFSWSEGHSTADLGYYRDKTYPASLEDARAHFNRYTENWKGESMPVLRQRLPKKGR